MNSAAGRNVVIIGAGISGLATAWWLHRKGFEVTVLEQSDRAGGAIESDYRDGFLVELGPNSTLETTPLIGKLLDELGIRDQLVYADEKAKNRFVVRNGRLYPLPMSPAAFLQTKLWSLGGKLRLLLEPFHARADKEETVAQFVTRRLGQEFLEYAIDPFVSGVYAGDPSTLSVRAAFPKLYALEERHGGLVLGLIRGRRERKQRAEVAKDRAKLFSFRRGMETLPSTIAEKLQPRIATRALHCKLSMVEYDRFGDSQKPHRWRVEYSKDGQTGHIDADAVVLSTPAYAAAEIIQELHAETAQALRRIPYPPVAMVYVGMERHGVRRDLDGFGFLVPKKEKQQILGTIWNSTIFPERAPAGSVALTTFVGGSRQPDLVSLSDEQLIQRVLQNLNALMQLERSPAVIIIRRWQRAIPQYNLGHLGIMEVVDAFEQRFAGVHVCSNFRGGIAIGDCVLNANKNAERVASFLSQKHSKTNQTEADTVESREMRSSMP